MCTFYKYPPENDFASFKANLNVLLKGFTYVYDVYRPDVGMDIQILIAKPQKLPL